MARTVQPLPELDSGRVLDRIAEAMRVGHEPKRLSEFPAWTQKVMRILAAQFIPKEFATIWSSGHSILVEGIVVALLARSQDLARLQGSTGAKFARELGRRLSLQQNAQEVAVQVASGAIQMSDDWQRQIMGRLFAQDAAEQRAFIEGLAIGHRIPELLDGQARRSTTDASAIYLILWLYWPEIAQLNSLGEVAHALEPFFAANKNLAGAHWDERIRKLGNRIGLSFRARQLRRTSKSASR
jgi:hypothetical protein